jgi:Fe-S-cluster containining protein
MADEVEILACGHPYILNETMVHTLRSCMKCADCCTCRRMSDIKRDFDEAAAALQDILNETQDVTRHVKRRLEKVNKDGRY